VVEEKDHSEEVKDPLSIISLLIIGLGVGWLAGLSVSPVATILISGLLAITIAIVGVISISLTYQNDKDKTIRSVGFKAAEKISIGLLALIVFGIALGVSLGICARTHNFLGGDSTFNGLHKEINELHSHCNNKWAELGIDKKVVAQRILDKYYPEGGVVKKSAATASVEKIAHSSAGLMSKNAYSHCEKLLKRSDPSFRRKYIQVSIDKNKYNQFIGLDKFNDKQLDERIFSICQSSE